MAPPNVNLLLFLFFIGVTSSPMNTSISFTTALIPCSFLLHAFAFRFASTTMNASFDESEALEVVVDEEEATRWLSFIDIIEAVLFAIDTMASWGG